MLTATKLGYFGEYGGAFIPEILHTAFEELTEAYEEIKEDPLFWEEFHSILENFSCRETPLTFAANLTKYFGTAKIYLKREDLNQTGSHKLNNVIGQWLLAKRLGKTRVIAETGAWQHGVATATMAAKFGLECVIYMGAKDIERQRPNVFWMEKLGAKVISVESGNKTLKDAVNAAFKDWVGNIGNTHYVLWTACGPHPFPEMVAQFQSIIGKEARQQILAQEGRLPTAVYACVGGGSNALWVFQGFMEDGETSLIGVEAGWIWTGSGNHASRIASGEWTPGVTQGYKTYFLQDNDGQLQHTHSIAAGLDYVGISPILVDLYKKKRVRFISALDSEVIEAHLLLMQKEGIIAALESTHAFSGVCSEIHTYSKDDIVIVNISGRGDKDIFTIAEAYKDQKWFDFLKSKVTNIPENITL